MKTRILEFLKTENKSSAQFADEIGVQPSSISHIISGRNNPSLDFVVKMLNKYPSLSTDWLIFGKGQMYREAQLHDLFNSDDNFKNNSKIDHITEGNLLLQNNIPVKEAGITKELDAGFSATRSKRIVFFFENGTFKEYIPD
jgi:transcriptional regulator with XRE-family HTH domain